MASTENLYSDLSRDELVALLEQSESGVRISFSGKATAREIARRVRPRVMQRLAKYSIGSPEQQADNLLLEGENLQAMVSLYRYRGHVDFILADPPYNTGHDFRYNDRWEDDPNDPDLGDIVSADDGARHTKWMRFMWPRLQTMRAMLKPSGVLAIDGCPKVMPLFEAKSSGFGVTERTLRASVDQGPDAGAHDCSRCANARSLRGPR